MAEACAESLLVLMADDDPDDCLLARLAFEETGISGEMRCVEDGRELIEYLQKEGDFAGAGKAPHPDVILLDLNMPRKDGREALKEIKSDSRFNDIPVVVLTTSREQRDITLCHNAGARKFITKPAEFDEWVEVMNSLRCILPQ